MVIILTLDFLDIAISTYRKMASTSTSLKVLLVFDVDAESCTNLAEHFCRNKPIIDLIICCGPFLGADHDSTNNDSTRSKELQAVANGNIASMLASLEQIQCRVIYCPSGLDPSASSTAQPYLTPNSINIHARKLDLRDDLYVIGFSETNDNLAHIDNIDNEDDDELLNVEVSSGMSSIKTIGEIINNSNLAASASNSVHQTGIFVLNYRFTHTLNHVLFHMPELLEAAHISICIIPQASDTLHLPERFGKLSIVSPRSLRTDGSYTVLDLALTEVVDGWGLVKTETLKLW